MKVNFKNFVVLALLACSLSLVACGSKPGTPGAGANPGVGGNPGAGGGFGGGGVGAGAGAGSYREGPGFRMHMPSGPRPAASVASYSGSEAESYRHYYDQRHRNGSWINSVNFPSGYVDITSQAWEDNANVSGYVIQDAALAAQLTQMINLMPQYVRAQAYQNSNSQQIVSGDILSQTVLAMDELEPVMNRLAEVENEDQLAGVVGNARRTYYANGIIVGRAFHDREVLSASQDQYLRFIQDTINNELRSLSGGQGFYVYAPFVEAGHGLFLHSNRHHSRNFENMMNAIRDNNEELFIRSMVNLGASFSNESNAGFDGPQARAGFLDAYTYLYVAKKFRSLGVRQSYLHFTLRCGHLH